MDAAQCVPASSLTSATYRDVSQSSFRRTSEPKTQGDAAVQYLNVSKRSPCLSFAPTLCMYPVPPFFCFFLQDKKRFGFVRETWKRGGGYAAFISSGFVVVRSRDNLCCFFAFAKAPGNVRHCGSRPGAFSCLFHSTTFAYISKSAAASCGPLVRRPCTYKYFSLFATLFAALRSGTASATQTPGRRCAKTYQCKPDESVDIFVISLFHCFLVQQYMSAQYCTAVYVS